MHALLKKGDSCIMASDPMPGMPVHQGSNFFININCDTRDEQDTYWNALSAGGTVTMPLADQFWGARFGMLTDKFGIGWMFNCYH